jgi:hypothetical protein
MAPNGRSVPARLGVKTTTPSASRWSAQLLAMMLTLLQTLVLHNVNPRTYLTAYLQACAVTGPKRPSNWNAGCPGTLRCWRSPGAARELPGARAMSSAQTSASARFCGRDFSPGELERIRAIIVQGQVCRSQLARQVCQEFAWLNAQGRLKEMSCKVPLLRMQRAGLLVLPPPRARNGNGKKQLLAQNLLAFEQTPLTLPAHQLHPLSLVLARTRPERPLKITPMPDRYVAWDSAGSKSSIKCGWIGHRTTQSYTTLIKSITDESSNSKQLTANNLHKKSLENP